VGGVVLSVYIDTRARFDLRVEAKVDCVKRLLVIEDNPTNRKLLGDILRLKGFDVAEAESAPVGLEMAGDGSFDLVLMDIQLPGMDGLEATRRLRADPVTKDLLIVAVTAHAMKGDEQRILNSGCDAYVTKPIAYKDFLETLSELFRNGRSS
jgi:two-component system cell cycle response regulator DivK